MILWLWLWHVWLTCDITLNSNSRFSINEMKKGNENKHLLNLISNVQWWYTSQHSLPSWTSFIYLKLRPCSRQMVQHISWNQGCSTSSCHQAQSLHTLCISKSTLWTFISWCEPHCYTYFSPSTPKISSVLDKFKACNRNSLLTLYNKAHCTKYEITPCLQTDCYLSHLH